MQRMVSRLVIALAIIAGLVVLSAQPASAQTLEETEKIFGGIAYPGVIHCHSLFSDGTKDIEELAVIARRHGAKFLVITDHFEDICQTPEEYESTGANKLKDRVRMDKSYGFLAYIDACREATKATGILVIPGIEVGIGTPKDKIKPEPDGAIEHILGVGALNSTIYDRLATYLGFQPGKRYLASEKTIPLREAQINVASIMHQEGMAVIAAHPFIRQDPFHDKIYTIYQDSMTSFDGVEFFNGTQDRQALEVLGVAGAGEGRNQNGRLCVTAGCDYHGYITARGILPFADEEKRFDRQTVIVRKMAIPFGSAESWDTNCQTVADHLRSSTTTVIASSGKYINEPSMDVYQNGRKLTTFVPQQTNNARGDPNKPMYAHSTGCFIFRVTPRDSLLGNSEQLEFPQEPRDQDLVTIPPPGGDLKITLVSTDGISDNRLGVIIAGRETTICDNVMMEPYGKTWRVGPYKTGDSLKFFIDSSYSGTRCYPVISTGKDPSWTLAFEDWDDNDNNDVVIRIEVYTEDSNSNTTPVGFKRIVIINNSSYEMRLHLAWHDENGWHNDDLSGGWIFTKGERSSLAQNNVPIHADRIKFWAESTNGRVNWRADRKNEIKNIGQSLGDLHTETFTD